ncbi:B9 domain-containing protein 1 [Anopheles bellator]|uniref:B9 domain-containing protein 1 n=1 Tax=Anopheles cruzii TaxID=68878 RepID=UPI0022EC2854|nr:B9 domain-containing protein 1 [Anopheles cruzii]XP_058053713.1 B9 domain-containing protein 1 [Anopheles bellator]
MLELQLTSGESESFFHLTVTGQLESAYFPMGPDGSGLFCRYDIVAGPDWELVSGLQSAVTQSARTESDYRTVVFNMPIEFTMKSTNPYGWPQIIFSLYGANVWNVETNRGYARVHCPLSGSHSAERTLRAPLFIPKYANACSAVMSWISGVNPEMRDPKILADGSKHKGLSSETYGELVVKLCAISRGSTRMALDWGQAALVDDKF